MSISTLGLLIRAIQPIFLFQKIQLQPRLEDKGELGLSDTKKILFGLAHCDMELEQKNIISFAINFCITFFAVIVKRYYKRKMRGERPH